MSDLIDRQAVIDLLKQMRKDGDMVPWEGKDVFARIRKLPTIQHEKAQLPQQGTTKDAISRQQAIDAAKDWYEGLICGSVNGLIKRLNALPPAQPEPHEGHWIKHIDPFDGEQYECSECGVLWEFNDGTPEDNEAYYCPNCGAKMKGGSNERTD